MNQDQELCLDIYKILLDTPDLSEPRLVCGLSAILPNWFQLYFPDIKWIDYYEQDTPWDPFNPEPYRAYYQSLLTYNGNQVERMRIAGDCIITIDKYVRIEYVPYPTLTTLDELDLWILRSTYVRSLKHIPEFSLRKPTKYNRDL